MSYIGLMMDWRKLFLSRQNRAVIGAIGIHVALGALLLTWRVASLPAQPEPIPVELIEIAIIDPPKETLITPEPQHEPLDEEPEPAEPDVLQVETPIPDLPEVSQAAPELPEIAELAQFPEALPPSSVSLAEEVDEAREGLVSEDVETGSQPPSIPVDVLPPEYVYKFDPFAETAPTALARVSKAINCARVNRETRPAFCPNYDEDDLFLASIAANRPSEWEQVAYDPVLDAATARGALGRFSARQESFGPNGRSEIGRSNFQKVVIPDEDCVAIGFGFENTVPGQPGHAVSIPDDKAVYCR